MPSKPPRTDWLPNNPDKETLLNWVNSSPDKVVLLKARDGDWELLALYLEGGEPVTPDIRKFLSEVLRGDRKRPKNRHSLASTVAREMEIAEFVMKQEDAGKRSACRRGREQSGGYEARAGTEENKSCHRSCCPGSL